MQRDAEAEKGFAKAIILQGGMEPAFRSHFSFANHYLRKGRLRHAVMEGEWTDAGTFESLALANSQMADAPWPFQVGIPMP